MHYKYITHSTETFSWAVRDGREVVVTYSLVEELASLIEGGDYERTRDGLRVHAQVTLDGGEQNDAWVRLVSDQDRAAAGLPTDIVARIGKILMTQDRLDGVSAARARIDAHPLMIEEREREQAARAATLNTPRYRPEVTGAERTRQERLYDNLHNEGGEGYNPWRDR